jgi:hypothetical protein
MGTKAKEVVTLAALSLTVLFNSSSSPSSSSSNEENYFMYEDAASITSEELTAIFEQGALSQYGSAESIEEACLAASLGDSLNVAINDNSVSSAAVARNIVRSMSDDELRDLPTRTKATLIVALTKDGKPKGKEMSALKRVYSQTGEDIAFELWDARKQYELATILKDDPAVIDARKNWGRYSSGKKAAALQHVSNIMMDVYGSGLSMHHIKVKAERIKQKNRNTIEMGHYKNVSQTIVINTKTLRNFNDTMEMILHETGHAFQDQLVRKYRKGQLDTGHDTYRQAGIFSANYRGNGYITADSNFDGYLSNPVEQHSRDMESVANYAGRGGSVNRADLDRAEKLYSDFESARKQAEIDALQNKKSCGGTFSP